MSILPLCCLTLTVALFGASADSSSEESISSNAAKGCAETEDNAVDEEAYEDETPSGHVSGERQEEKRKWGDSSMRAWGKREGADKRDWNRSSLRAWGKREGEEGDVDKKTWWSKSRLGPWSKRDDGREEEKLDQKEESEDGKKRGWEKSGPLRAWGKRLDGSSGLKSPSAEESKRDWNSRVRAWGKRDEGASAEEKTMAAERVRRAIEGNGRRPKRSWRRSSDAATAAAEDFFNHINFYPPEGPKRSWRTNVIRVWGKRTIQ